MQHVSFIFPIICLFIFYLMCHNFFFLFHFIYFLFLSNSLQLFSLSPLCCLFLPVSFLLIPLLPCILFVYYSEKHLLFLISYRNLLHSTITSFFLLPNIFIPHIPVLYLKTIFKTFSTLSQLLPPLSSTPFLHFRIYLTHIPSSSSSYSTH